jgi:acyl-CoA thioesterase
MSSPQFDDNAFDRDTELIPSAGGELRGSLSECWLAGGGPHGGYVAALILRGLMMVVGDASRAPLTLTIQFLRQPAFGEVELHATVERTGRTLTSLTARLRQGDDTVAVALASFVAPMTGVEYGEVPMPEVEGPWTDRRSLLSDEAPVFAHHLVMQPRFGRPFEGRDDPMVAGGWTALPGKRPIDAPALALFSDAWYSPPYVRLDHFLPSPTVTLSVYFRARLPRPSAGGKDICLARFQTRLVRDGFFHSDGVIWAQDGTVLAESHQLQLLLAS